MKNLTETVAAISTPPGEGGIGIIRISGAEALHRVQPILSLTGLKKQPMKPRMVYHGFVIDPKQNRKIDEVICFYFIAPHSYTGEDVVEIQTHGGMVVLQKVLQLLFEQGIAVAEAGEFTKRAFLNGRLDLTQAEAVMDLIQADSSAGAAQAMDQLDGLLGRFLKKVIQRILSLIAAVEVSLDFPEDYESLDHEAMQMVLEELLTQLEELIETAQQGRLVRQGLKVVIAGRPNVGKSSLLNSLLGEDRAIVTARAGTTRDVLEERLSLDGIVIRLVDTAGLHESEDEIEQLGMARTRSAINSADLILWVMDANETLQQEDYELAELIQKRPMIPVINKTDVSDGSNLLNALIQLGIQQTPVLIAAAPGQGLHLLRDAMRKAVFSGKVFGRNQPVLTRLWHQEKVSIAVAQLRACKEAIVQRWPEDCYVIHLKEAYQALASILGEVASEEIIRTIFEQFCVGK